MSGIRTDGGGAHGEGANRGGWLAGLAPLSAWMAGAAQASAGRTLAVVIAIAIGVGMGLAVYLINRTALDELSGAVQFLLGDTDLELRGPRDGFDESAYARVARLPEIEAASPVVEANARIEGTHAGAAASLRVVGIDVLRVGPLNAGLVPEVARTAGASDGDRRSTGELFDADTVFLSPAALEWLGVRAGDLLQVRVGAVLKPLRIAGTLPGAPRGQRVAVMDIGAAQWQFDRLGVLHRIDVKLRQGTDEARARAALSAVLPEGVHITTPEDASKRTSNLSRAYRVNLNVLALVALFTGAFLVFSTQALSIVRRRPQIALLRALGASSGRITRMLVIEALVVGAAGAAVGVALGISVAAIAIARFGADLGGGYFPGIEPRFALEPFGIALFFVLGVLATLAGSAAPIIAARREPVASGLRAFPQALPSQGSQAGVVPGLVLVGVAAVLVALPAWSALPLAGYLAIALLLVAGILLTPSIARRVFHAIEGALRRTDVPAWLQLAASRARAATGMTTLALASVVAAFAVMVAMAIMVSSFRSSVDQWLVSVLPADLYLRSASTGDTGYLSEPDLALIRALPGVAALEALGTSSLTLDPLRPAVALIVRPIDAADPGARLPLIGRAVPAPQGQVAVYVSEPVARIYGLQPGDRVTLALGGQAVECFVAAVWRDYSRQFGAITVDTGDYRRFVPDARPTDAALWLAPGATAAEVTAGLAAALPGFERFELAEPGAIRAYSLRIFDRSFAITYLLEAVAVVIGLFGVASTFSAEALARGREFGVQRCLGMTRREIALQLAAEGALFAALGALIGGLLGLAISLVLIDVINPQSFNWTMPMDLPTGFLAVLAVALVLAASVTAVVSARGALSAAAVQAVRDDW
jgi:putative ABC transport system permease protein